MVELKLYTVTKQFYFSGLSEQSAVLKNLMMVSAQPYSDKEKFDSESTYNELYVDFV